MTWAGAFLARRRRDVRFRVVPYNAFQIANAAAVTVSVIAVLVFVLDPLLVAWQASLPEPHGRVLPPRDALRQVRLDPASAPASS